MILMLSTINHHLFSVVVAALILDLAFRGDVASDRQVLTDYRWDHLARIWAGAL